MGIMGMGRQWRQVDAVQNSFGAGRLAMTEKAQMKALAQVLEVMTCHDYDLRFCSC